MAIVKTDRVLEIVKKIIEKKSVTIKELANEFDVSIRSIQRDIKDNIIPIMGDQISREKDIVRFVDKGFVHNMLFENDRDELEKFIDISIAADDKFIERLDEKSKKYINNLKKEFSNIYTFKRGLIEERHFSSELLSKVKSAIKGRRYSDIEYLEDSKKSVYKNARLLRIVFAEGNFYAVGLAENALENNGLKFFRLNFIKDITIEPKEFNKTGDVIRANDYIDSFQTLLGRFGVAKFDVVISVDSSVKKYFKEKKFLPSQKIISEDENGNLLLEYKVTDEMEILPLVKRWMPLIDIIEPLHMKERLLNDMRGYIQKHSL